MASPLSSSVLPWKWIIEYLADVPDVGTSILSALVDRFPDVLADPSGAVRERLALRYLEECSGMACGETPPAVANNAPSTSASAAKIDAAQTCEEVLQSKVAAVNDDSKGKACLDDGDLHQFILLKRATLPKSSIDMLKEKIVGSFLPDFSYSKECNDLPKISRPSPVNHLTSNNHSDHDGIKKIIRTMKHASPWLKKLTITRKYRKSKNLANNTPLRTVGGASQKFCSTQQSNLDGTCNVQFLTTEKSKTNTCEEFHDAPNGSPENFEGSLRSGQQFRKQIVLQDDREDLQEVADGGDDVQLLEKSSIPKSSSSQSLCIRCSRSGQLLNCHGNGCSRSIHESCVGLLGGVEENGLFYCPFCAYRNARMMYEKSKRKAEEARRNLFSFYDICPAVNVLKRKNSSAKSITGSDQVSANHNNNKHQDLPSNQQLTGAQKHNDNQIAETSNSKFVRKNNQEITQNQQNQLNGEDDIVYKIILPCRETIECQTLQDVQDEHIKLKSDSAREHESAKVEEDQQPVNDYEINENDNLLSDVNTSSHERNGDDCVTNSRNEIKNVHTGDADQEHTSLQTSKRSPLKVEGERDHNAKRKALASQISDSFVKRNRRAKAGKIDNAKRKALASQISDSFVKRNRREKAGKIDNYEGVVEYQQRGSSSSRELRKNTLQNRCLTQKRSPSRRTTLIWKPQEEEILEEAMYKIPKNEDGSIPWIKILEYGRRFLHESRTPIDLKDKWRNMQKKEAKKRI